VIVWGDELNVEVKSPEYSISGWERDCNWECLIGAIKSLGWAFLFLGVFLIVSLLVIGFLIVGLLIVVFLIAVGIILGSFCRISRRISRVDSGLLRIANCFVTTRYVTICPEDFKLQKKQVGICQEPSTKGRRSRLIPVPFENVTTVADH